MNPIVRFLCSLHIIALLAIISSGAAHAQTGGLPAAMRGVTWTLTAIQPTGGPRQDTTGSGTTIRFDEDGSVEGNSSCNSYGGQYQVGSDQALTLSRLLSTLRACVDPTRMALETTYFAALGKVSAYQLAGTTLRLTYDGQNILEFQTSAVGTPTPSAPGMPNTGSPNALPWLAGLLALAGVAVGWAGRAAALAKD